MRNPLKRVVLFVACLAVSLTSVITVFGGEAHAGSFEDTGGYWRTCGKHAPANGLIETTHWDGGSDYWVTFKFKLTEQELNSLRCVDEFLEIDFRLFGFDLPGYWKGYQIPDTNLPGAIQDEPAGDTAPTPAVTNIKVANLQKDTEYYVTLAWNARVVAGEAQSVSVQWVPSHWAREGNPEEILKEKSYCIWGTAVEFDPAWCIFGTTRTFLSFDMFNGQQLPFGGFRAFPYGSYVAAGAPQEFPRSLGGSVRDGALIQSDENHLYVLAGGRLFWFDKNDVAQRDEFRAQARRLTGSDSYVRLYHDTVHALEVNRDPAGNLSPGSNMPADNVFLYEYGSGTQYVIKYVHPFPIGSPEEVIALGGQNKAIMVPKSIGQLGQHAPQWVDGDQIRFWNDPAVWYYSDRGYRVPSVPTRDCLSVRHGGRGVTLLPASARALFPDSGQNASCDFEHGQWLYGQPSNRQIMVLYGAGHQVQYGEIAPLGGVDRAVPVSDETIDGLLARGMTLPDNHVFRAAGQSDVYLSGGGQWHHVGSPGQRDCLLFKNSAVEEIVPASFIGRLPQGSPATCRLGDGAWLYDTSTNQQYLTVFGSAFQVQYGELAPLGGVDKAKPISHEGTGYLADLDFSIPDNEMIKGFGPAVYQVKSGKLQYVGNPAIRDCLTAATGKQVRQVPEDVITRMKALGRVGPDAQCALEGKQLLGPNGTSVAWIKDGYRRPVINPAIRDCLAVRANAGAPLRADQGVWDSYQVGPNAYCPYPASMRFVRGDGQSAAWRVYPDGTRQLLNAYCHDVDPANANDPRYKVYVVPAGEVDGHALRQPNVFNVTVESCRALP